MRAIGNVIFYLACWPGIEMRESFVGRPTPKGNWFLRGLFNIVSIYTIASWIMLAAAIFFVFLPWLNQALAD